MKISKVQIFALKSMTNRIVTKGCESLDKRFLNEEIEICRHISNILSPGTKVSVNEDIEFLANMYPSTITTSKLRSEICLLDQLKKSYPSMSMKKFCGVLVGSYKSLVPQCCDLAEKYLLAPVQNAVVERTFSFQNIILTPHRNRFLIENFGKKLFVKYTKFFLS